MITTRRLLIVIALLLSPLLFGWAGDDAEEKAVQALKELEGRIVRDEKAPGKPVIEVLILDEATDENVKHLANFKELQKLGLLFSRDLTDTGLQHLAKLTKLQELSLQSTGLTDAGLKHLAKLKQL